MQYDIIVADPPWAFGDRLQKMKAPTKRSAASQYSTMSATEIAALDVGKLANPEHCVLALWVPSTLLQDGFMVMDAWGFAFKQTYVWVKTKKNLKEKLLKMLKLGQDVDPNNMMAFGMGRLFRQTHELALIGTMGKVYDSLENKSQRSVLFDLNQGHSTKPEGLQDSLELMFPHARKLELFARRPRATWATIGDAVTGKDIKESIQGLITL